MRKITIGFILLLISCGTKSNFIKFSNDILKDEPMYKSDEIVYASIKAKDFLNRERKIRNKIYRDGNLSFFTTKEPFYTLEGYDMESGISYCTMWNSKGSVNYEYHNMNYKISEEHYYSENLRHLIEGWKIEIIEKNVKEKGGLLGGLELTTRAIFFTNSKTIKEIKSFGFEEYDDNEEINQ